MTYEQVSEMIASVGIPYAYYQFDEGTAEPTPFICFYFSDDNSVKADNVNYVKIQTLVIELYTDEKDFNLENRIEGVLDANELPYDHVESYIDSEKMLMQTYTTEVVINGN